MEVDNIVKILHIKNKVKTPLDLVELEKKGLPKKSVILLGRFFSATNSDMASWLLVSPKTIWRYNKNLKGLLKHRESERVLKLAMLASRCKDVFEGTEICNEWLRSNNTALGGKTPFSLMQSNMGIEMVLTELGRIEYGVIS
ncbi:MAG TPA: antitoxin Xre/MbcA/ParS toxin-binding domain-containing protein [Syntrophales bacterium]|nr:antitoxin Xre/MbcA/ParS toxin-binding domain-containing protein [Syntrophales bacterium]